MAADENLRRGFMGFFNAIMVCIDKGLLPKINAVTHSGRTSQNQHTKEYLRRGGKIDNVVRAVFEQARTGCVWAGDGSGLALYSDKLTDLKRCRNDGEYACVALACGVKDL